MFKWFTKERTRIILYVIWNVLMVTCLFLNRIDLSIYGALMLILMELETLNRAVDFKSDKNES